MLHKVSDLPQEARDAAFRLEQYFGEIDRQHPALAPDEAESALEEAMRSIRPGYVPHR